jgi:nitroimidazol reductase NimA-like FMN-containing flavoprotein (pyridoxamine 5'-phosphate oxidase superfamily)
MAQSSLRGGNMLEKMKALIQAKDICVWATVSGDKPHCSLMAYAADDTCHEIYMVTHKKTKKYKNLMKNPHVSLLIDSRDEDMGPRRFKAKALTVSGVFEKIEDQGKKDFACARLLKGHPHLKEFALDPDAEVLRIIVTSFLLLDGLTDSYFEIVG